MCPWGRIDAKDHWYFHLCHVAMVRGVTEKVAEFTEKSLISSFKSKIIEKFTIFFNYLYKTQANCEQINESILAIYYMNLFMKQTEIQNIL